MPTISNQLDPRVGLSKGFKHTIAATGSLAATWAGLSNAAAADLPRPPPAVPAPRVADPFDSWSVGFGGSFDSYRTGVTTNSFDTYDDGSFSTPLNPKGLRANIELGRDFRSGDHVFGVYGDFLFGDPSASFASTDDNGPSGWLSIEQRLSLIARGGVVITPHTLVYGLAGWSIQHYVAEVSGVAENSDTFDATRSGYMNGPTVGAGLEYLFRHHPHLSLKGEYRFTHFSAPSVTANDGVATITADFKPVNDNAFRLILSWKFGNP